MEIQGLEIIPLLWATWTSVGVICTLSMAIIAGHIESSLPFISDTGSHHPESIVFTVVFSISAALGAWTVYLFYKRMTLTIGDTKGCNPPAQKVLLLVGWMMCLGLLCLANLQNDLYPGWHFGGTVAAIIFGSVYHISQAFCLATYTVSSGSKHVSRLRAALCVVTILTLLTLIACKLSAFMSAAGQRYTVRIVSAAGEWAIAVTLMLSILTYMPEFQRLCMKWPGRLHGEWIYLKKTEHAGPECK